ncbi:FtsX-like permease family protein [Pontiellaceae bacterium B12227]|nr:FtsX-like permease family protein [Pontiellaceae bacterium B12227]
MSTLIGIQSVLLHLKRFSWRHVLKAPATTCALLAVVALGVAVFFSVRLSSRAAVSGFQLFTQSISGGSDFVVTGPGNAVPVDRLPELRNVLDPLPLHLLPMVEGTATLPGTGKAADDFDAVQVPILGIDLLAARNLAYARDRTQYQTFETTTSDQIRIGVANEVHITELIAKRLQVKPGDFIDAVLGDQLLHLNVASVLITDEFQAGKNEALLVMDLPALQSLLGQEQHVDRVEVVIPEGNQTAALRQAVTDRLNKLNAAQWIWSTTESQRDSAQTMTAAFRLNLTILSALSVLVGIYLILQAMEAAVVRRRSEIGILLSMGYEPKWIRAAWLMESLLLGITGSALGLLLGWALAQLAVRGVAQTVNALYVSTTAEAASWNSGEALMAFGIGVAATVIAGLLPARDAASTQPIQVIRQEGHNGGIYLLDAPWLGFVLLAVGGLFSRMPALDLSPGVRLPVGGYLAALTWLIGAAVLSANLLRFIPGLFKRAAIRGAVWRVAVSQFRQPSGRQKLTVAGLVVAVGMAAGMEILTHSFERTVSGWIHQSLKADLFVAVKGIENASNRNKISEATWRKLIDDPKVERAEVGHFFPIELRGLPTMLMGIRSTQPWSDEKLIWAEKPVKPVQLDRPLDDGCTPALISESFAVRYQMGRGDELEVPTPAGNQSVRVLGVYADYGNERGALLMDGALAARWFNDLRAVNLAATLRPGADPDQVREQWTAEHPGLAIRTNRALREEVLKIFHQTFAVTHALKIIGIAVAFSGLALALFSLLMDRRQELVTLRELGFQRRDIMAAVTLEGLLLSLIGLVAGLLLSLALGYLLIYVINKQSFGWTLAYAVPAIGLAVLSVGVLLAAALTSLGIGRWAARLKAEEHE